MLQRLAANRYEIITRQKKPDFVCSVHPLAVLWVLWVLIRLSLWILRWFPKANDLCL